MHLHYARGCSLAEAFYQSVWGPYQLLVLGDPLTQPFAKGIDVHIDRPSGKEPLSKQVAIDPSFDVPSGEALGTKELWVDGRRVQAGPATELLAWDTTSVADGAHEIRVVAVEDGTIATRSSDARWVEVDNGSGFAVSIRPPDPVEIGGPLRLEGRAEGAHDVDLMRGAEVLATAPVARDRWKVAIETLRLGLGETTLQARGRAGGDREVWSRPVVVEIRPPDELEAARSLTAHDAVPGLHVVWTDEHGATHEGFAGTLAPRGRERSFAEDLDALGARDARRVVVEGSVRVPAGLAEVRVDGPESLEMSVDGRTVSFAADSSRTALLPLAEGWHDLRIRAEGPGVDRLAVEVGGSRARAPLAGADLAWLPGNLAPAERPASVTGGEEGRATAVLGDGGRAGAHGVDVGPDRAVVLAWDDKQRHVSTVVLYASSGDKASPITTRWTVETRTSDRGRWRDVHDLEALVAPPAARPKKNETLGPRFVLLRFHATTAKEVRVRPAKGEGTSRVAEVEIYAGTR
jgi:hypothetical protein